MEETFVGVQGGTLERSRYLEYASGGVPTPMHLRARRRRLAIILKNTKKEIQIFFELLPVRPRAPQWLVRRASERCAASPERCRGNASIAGGCRGPEARRATREQSEGENVHLT